MEIAEKIQRLMDERGITPYRLAKETGVSYTGLSKILSQQTKNPQIDSLKAIAAYFGKSVDYFTEEETVETPDWATAKDIRDFKKMLEEDSPIMFDGVPMDNESRQRVMDVLTGLFWDAKKQNKKTYGRKAKTDTNDKE